MCLGIPMRVIEMKGATGIVEMGRVKYEAGFQLVDEVKVGDYVILHAGFAIQKLDEKEAQETIA
ncbi:MAG: HypC/HybG/HupF family hydrogenase formation chaperone, partial [Nitrospirae bacterium]|nr:HypC/HybG/HupF family hydrogenase formation chaperone [Nitrospirota bacterium]